MTASIIGTWDLTVDTPLGKQHPIVTNSDEGGVITVTTENDDSGSEYGDITTDGDTVSWTMVIRKPTRMQFNCTVTVSGDTFEGLAKNRFLPNIKLSATRKA